MEYGRRIGKLKERVQKAFSNYTELGGGRNYRYHHSLNVMKICYKMLEEMNPEVDREIVLGGALLHDIGRTEDINKGFLDPFESKEGHAERGESRVEEFAGDFFNVKELKILEKIVGNHDSEPKTLEGKIVQDADMLDVYGVSNLWRMFNYAFEKEKPLRSQKEYFFAQAVPGMRENLDNFNFDFIRNVAEKRLEKHVKAFKQICREIDAEDISKST